MDQHDRRPADDEPAPPETPEGTAAEAPGRERTSMDREPPAAEDPLIREQEEAAAAEAGRIGGPGAPAAADPAMQPLYEAGQGEAEGFEQSERELGERASHGDERSNPTDDAFTPEAESDRSTAVYGEPDEIDPTEVRADPREGGDDPGRGTDLAPDR